MTTNWLSLDVRSHFIRRLSIGLAALAVSILLPIDPARAQPRPPTIPNTHGPVTVHSTVGGPNAITFTFGSAPPAQPAPMTFAPALSPPPASPWPSPGAPTYAPPTQPMTFAPAIALVPQQPARIFYVYFRHAPELPWTCLGGYRMESQAQQSVIGFRRSGAEAFYR